MLSISMRFTDRYFYFGSKPDSREPEDIYVHHVSGVLVGRPLPRLRQGEKAPSMHVVLVVMPVDKMTNKFVSACNYQ